ncbi:MAG: response regulator [Gammaproteobacteria bacterium]|nr:response regulator [Gammaproteobacteria bacterium]MDH5693322.1 response regulator [Gammaproteobacteria bacterium]
MKRVLVIEDNENNMELISFILSRNGYSVVRAETGMEGLELAMKIKPDLVILDIQLPDIDGTVVLRNLKQRGLHRVTPIIAMTSFAMAGDRESLIEAGCSGYIEKPIDPDRVVSQIEEILDAFVCEY